MKKDVRQTVKHCSTCQILNVKRAHAHNHFSDKIKYRPKKSMDNGLSRLCDIRRRPPHILGSIDMTTVESQLFDVKRSTVPNRTDEVLQGIVLRDGVSDTIHSVHAKELVGTCVTTLVRVFDITRTTTLAHHPTGNAKIERL